MRNSGESINTVIIVGGGAGRRLGSDLPKVFVEFAGKPLICYSLETFQNSPLIDSIILVVPSQHIELAQEIITRSGISKALSVIEGGAERQDSVWKGLEALPERAENILIHDGARPFISNDLISQVIMELADVPAVIPALKVKESLKIVKKEQGSLTVASSPDRDEYYFAQTPQGFRRDVILDSFSKARQTNLTGTDEAMIVTAAGYPVAVIEGEENNLKITTSADLRTAELILKNEPGIFR